MLDLAEPGTDLNDILVSEGVNALKQFLERAQPWRDPNRLSFLDIEEIFNLVLPENDNYLGDRLLARSESMALLGEMGIGKSRLFLQLIVDSILGREWCGLPTYNTELKWALSQDENNAHRIRADLGPMLRGITRGEREKVRAQLKILTPISQIDREINFAIPEAVARLEREARAFGADVFAFDPVSNHYGGENENDARQMIEFVRAAWRIARAGNPDAALVLLHHARTGRAGAAASIGRDRAAFGRGSKALAGSMRAIINVVPGLEDSNEVLVLTCGKSNNGRGFEPRAVRLNPETMTYELDHDFDLSEWRDSISDQKSGGRGAVYSPAIVATVLKAAGKNLRWRDLNDAVVEASGCKSRKADELIKAAIENGSVTKAAGFYSLCEAGK